MSIMSQQIPMFPRPRHCEINGEDYASVFDLLRIYGGSDNPREDWRRIRIKLIKQGYDVSEIPQHQFPDSSGKLNRPTPVVNKVQIARIAQITDYPAWEPIRQRQAEIFVEEQEQKQRGRQLSHKTYRALRNVGYSHDRALEWHDIDNHSKDAHDRAVREWIARHGNIGQLTNAVTRVVLGKSATAWKREHNTTESPRRFMSSLKKGALAIVEEFGAILHRRRNSDGTDELLEDLHEASQIIDWDKLNQMFPDDDLLPPTRGQQRQLPKGSA